MTAPNRIFKYPYTAHVCDTYGCFNRAQWAEGNPEGPRNQWIRRCDACMKAALGNLPAELLPQQPKFYALAFTAGGEVEVTDLEGNVLGKLQPSAGEFQLQVDLEDRTITVLYAGAPVGEAQISDEVRDAIFAALEDLDAEDDEGSEQDEADASSVAGVHPVISVSAGAGAAAAAAPGTKPCPNPNCGAQVVVPSGGFASVTCPRCKGIICVECWKHFKTAQGFGGHRVRAHAAATQQAADLL